MTEHWWRQRFPDGTMAQNKEYYLQGIMYCLGVKGSQRESKGVKSHYFGIQAFISHPSSIIQI